MLGVYRATLSLHSLSAESGKSKYSQVNLYPSDDLLIHSFTFKLFQYHTLSYEQIHLNTLSTVHFSFGFTLHSGIKKNKETIVG